jgi:hypothetical protein
VSTARRWCQVSGVVSGVRCGVRCRVLARRRSISSVLE